jgi:SPOR domain
LAAAKLIRVFRLVGPFASAEKAAKLCRGLKAAGGDCIVQKKTDFACGAPLVGREGNFVLKYFMLRKAARKKGWRRRNEKSQPASASDQG